jgi:hypothetical protein
MREIVELALTCIGILVAGGTVAVLTYKVGDMLRPKIVTFLTELRDEMRAHKLGEWHLRHNNEITW